MHNRYQGSQGGGLPSFFEGQSSLLGRSRREPLAANPLHASSSDEKAHSNDEIFWEIEDYAIEAEMEDRVRASDPPFYVLTLDVWWSEGASSFDGAGPSTSGAPPADFDFQYTYEDWLSGLSTKKLGFISCEYRLEHLAC